MNPTPTATPTAAPTRYLEPDAFTRKVWNPAIRRLTVMGLSIRGSSELRIRGRKSGEWRSNIVNPLPFDGAEYLVAPRGTTQWVRNLRAAGGGELRVGRRVDAFTFVEVPDTDKVPVLRAYLTLWKFEVGRFFDGVGPDATDSEISAIAVGYPVFRVIRAAS